MARHGACWEQDLYSDTLISAVAGRPLFYHCWMPEEKVGRCGCGMWEQDLYNDILISAVAGRPLFYHCWMPEENVGVVWVWGVQEVWQVTSSSARWRGQPLFHNSWMQEGKVWKCGVGCGVCVDVSEPASVTVCKGWLQC